MAITWKCGNGRYFYPTIVGPRVSFFLLFLSMFINSRFLFHFFYRYS